jgi:hypothetical protein
MISDTLAEADAGAQASERSIAKEHRRRNRQWFHRSRIQPSVSRS